MIVSGHGFKKSYMIFRKGKQLFHAAGDVNETHDVFEVFPHMEDELYKNSLWAGVKRAIPSVNL